MTPEARIEAVETVTKFTRRQSAFLVLVMVHSGVCVRRQYAAFTGMVYGQATKDFFKRLVKRKLASIYASAHGRALVFHVHAKPLYAAIGEADNRNRKPITLPRAVERLMVLDAVIADRKLRWLGTESEKVEYFSGATQLRPSELPLLRFGEAPQQTTRWFPDKLPIGVTGDGRTHVFLYLVTRKAPVDFRAFLHRHAELFRALPEWELRVMVPRHFDKAARVFTSAATEELATPIGLTERDDLKWYFRQRQRLEEGLPTEDPGRFNEAALRFRAPRYRALYRASKKSGDGALHAIVSRILADAISRRRGRVVTHVLPHFYQHLSPLVGTA